MAKRIALQLDAVVKSTRLQPTPKHVRLLAVLGID